MLTAQCPSPPSYDARLLVAPCAFQPLTEDANDPFAVVITTQNNHCARQIRQTLIELQRVTQEYQGNARLETRE